MTATRTVAPTQTKPACSDAIAMLTADREAVRQLFAEYECTRSIARKKALIAEICMALSVHTQIKEEIFYPELSTASTTSLLVLRARVEHLGVRVLIAQLQGADPGGKWVDAKVRALSDHVKRQVREEHNETFPTVEAASLDMVDLGARMAARKEDLLAKAARAER